MKRLLPSRRALKWTGLVLSVLVAALWGASVLWYTWLIDGAPGRAVFSADLGEGQFKASLMDLGVVEARRRRWGVERVPTPIVRWMPDYEWSTNLKTLAIPIWIPFLVAAAPTAYLWWHDRRGGGAGLCPKCRYDLTGLAPDAPCPECGAKGGP